MFPPDYPAMINNMQRANLVRYWPLDDQAGNADDLSPYAEDGTYAGPTLENDNAPDGRPCPTFDGNNDSVDIGTNLDTDLGQWSSATVFGWMKVSATGIWTDGTYDNIIDIEGNGDNNMFFRKTSGNNEVQWKVELSSESDFDSYTLPAGLVSSVQWISWAVTWNWTGSQTDIVQYINGAQVNTATNSQEFDAGVLNWDARIGSSDSGAGSHWSGAICHVALWSTDLTASEILLLHKSGNQS